MSLRLTNKRWPGVLLVTGALVSCGALGVGRVRAQGLDMDANPNAPLPATTQGGLDTDVNPNAPIAPPSPVKASPRDSVQDGIAPLNVRSTPDAPTTPDSPQPGAPQPGAPQPGAPQSDAAQLPAGPSDAGPASPAPVADQPVAAAAEPVVLDHPKVIDTAKLQSGETSVSLYGIEGLAGEPAQGLQGFLAAGDGHVTCQAQENTGFVCLTADGTNIAQVALVNGAAKTTPDAPDAYREQEAAAQAARRGIWANLPPPPETVQHPTVQDTATLSAGGKTYALDGIVGFQAPYSGPTSGLYRRKWRQRDVLATRRRRILYLSASRRDGCGQGRVGQWCRPRRPGRARRLSRAAAGCAEQSPRLLVEPPRTR